MPEESKNLGTLKDRFGDVIFDTHSYRGDDTIIIDKQHILEVCRFLRDEADLSFDFMMDLTVVDELDFAGVADIRGTGSIRAAPFLASHMGC